MTLYEFFGSVLTTSVKEAQSGSELPSDLYRKEMDAKLRAVLLPLYAICSSNSEKIWEDMGQILLCGKSATKYYDLVSTFLVFLSKQKVPDLTGSLMTALDNFCTEVSEEVYCRMLRRFCLKYCSHNSALYSNCAILHLLIVEWYQCGMQSGGWQGDRVSLFQQADVTLLEMIVLLSELDFKTPRNYYPVRQKDVRAVRNVLSILNSEGFVEDLVKTMKENVKVIDFNTIMTASVYSAIENLFNPGMQANVCLHFLSIERENRLEESIINGAVNVIVQGTGVDVLKYRKLFVREEGVILHFQKPFDKITEVALREVHREGLHYIIVRYCLRGQCYRDLVLNIEDLETSFMTFMYEIDFSLTLGLLCWLGLKERMIAGLERVALLSGEDVLKAEIATMIERISTYFEDENLYYSEPIWWNYDQVKSKFTPRTIELTKIINVGTYSRRLPQGQQASENARTLARKYCMILEPGYTLVERFKRRQRIRRTVIANAEIM